MLFFKEHITVHTVHTEQYVLNATLYKKTLYIRAVVLHTVCLGCCFIEDARYEP